MWLSSVIVLVSSILLVAAGTAMDAHAHGIGPSLVSRILRIDNEQFSDNTFATTQPGVITGELISVSEKQLNLSIRLYVTPAEVALPEGRVGGIPWYYSQLSTIYPPFRDQSAMYFRIESTMPERVVLEPGDSTTYEIKFFPLKAGAYHVHTYVITEDGARIGRGQTIIVDGENRHTQGEILQLYLPVVLFVTAAAILSAILLRQSRLRGWRQVSIGFFFVFKSSYETMLVAGVVTSLLLSPNLLQDTVVLVNGLAVWLSAITVGSYFLIVTGTRRNTIAIGTLVATSIFYFVLVYSGCSFAYSRSYPFNFDSSYVSLIAVGNAIAAGLVIVLIARERKMLRQNV